MTFENDDLWWRIQVDLAPSYDLVFVFNNGAANQQDADWHNPFGNPTGNFITSDTEVWVKDGYMTTSKP